MYEELIMFDIHFCWFFHLVTQEAYRNKTFVRATFGCTNSGTNREAILKMLCEIMPRWMKWKKKDVRWNKKPGQGRG